MRITQNMMARMFTGVLRRQTLAMIGQQERIATQKRINRPSDDPAGAGRVLSGRGVLAGIEKYASGIQQGKSRLEFNEETLKLIGDLVRQARRTAEEKSAGGVSAAERALAATTVREIADQVLQLANARFNGEYVFGGDRRDVAPFVRDDEGNVTYRGESGAFFIPLPGGARVAVDADGRNYFQNEAAGGVNLFDELRDLIGGLENPDLEEGTAQIQATLDPLERAEVQLRNKRAEAAPQAYRLQTTEEHLTRWRAAVEAAIGRDEDADVAQAIVELKNLEVAYESTLAAASRILQPSLVDFLR
ncbi:MAG: flagellar hook-associated protein FlgL [Desulfobacterales bacterium]